MKIAEKYSHLNGEEYILVHHKNLFKEIKDVIASVDASLYLTKTSKEKTMIGKMLYSPIELNKNFSTSFRSKGWNESRYKYYITTNRKYMEEKLNMKLSL